MGSFSDSIIKRGASFRRSLKFSKKDKDKPCDKEPLSAVPEGSAEEKKEEKEEEQEEEEEAYLREEMEEAYTLPELPHTPLSGTRFCTLIIFPFSPPVMQINKLIEMEVLEEAHLNLLAMRQEFRQEQEKCGEDSSMELAKKEKDLSLLYGDLRKKINTIVRDSNSFPSRNKGLLVPVARIIQEEEKRAEEPGGLPDSWMEAWREAVCEGVQVKVDGVHLEPQEQNVSWLAVHLGLLGKSIVLDLESVKKELRSSYPPSFKVFSTYVRSYHRVVGQHLKKLERQTTELKDLYSLLDWIINRYKSEKIMGSLSLQPNMKDESADLQLEDDFLQQLKGKYCSKVKEEMRFSLDRIIQNEFDDVWKERKSPEKDEEFLDSQIHMDVWTRVKGNAVSSQKIDAQLGQKVISSCLEELKQFPKRFETDFRRHCSAFRPQPLWTEYQITYINSFAALQKHMEEYRDACPDGVEAFKKEVKWLIVKLRQDLEDQFKEDVKPYLRKMMTRKWLTDDSDFKQLYKRTEELSQHCALMRPPHVEEFASHLHYHVAKEYVGQLMKNNYTCKNQKHEKAAKKIREQWGNLGDLFEDMKSTHKWLHPVGDDLSDIIMQKNKADIKKHLQPIVEHYPDFSKKHLVAVLYFRGLLRGREYQLILQTLTELKKKLGSVNESQFHRPAADTDELYRPASLQERCVQLFTAAFPAGFVELKRRAPDIASVAVCLITALRVWSECFSACWSRFCTWIRTMRLRSESTETDGSRLNFLPDLSGRGRWFNFRRGSRAQPAGNNTTITDGHQTLKGEEPQPVIRTYEQILEAKDWSEASQQLIEREECLFGENVETEALKNHNDEVDKLAADYKNLQGLILETLKQSLTPGEDNLEVLASATRAISQEVVQDQQWKQRGQTPPAWRPCDWKNLHDSTLHSLVEERIDNPSMSPADQAAPSSFQANINSMGRQLKEDLLFVVKEVKGCYPPEMDICNFYAKLYHQAFSARLRKITEFVLEYNDGTFLLRWVNEYYPEILQKPELASEIDINALGKLLTKEFLKPLEEQYLNTKQDELMTYIRRVLEQEKENWNKGEEPKREDGCFISHVAYDIIQLVNGMVTSAEKILGDLHKAQIITSPLKDLMERDVLTKRKHLFIEDVRETCLLALPDMKQSAHTYLLKPVHEVLKPQYRKLGTNDWLNKSAFAKLLGGIEEELQGLQGLVESCQQELVGQLHQEVTAEYVKRLLRGAVKLKDKERQLKAYMTVKNDAESLHDLFSRMGSKQDWLKEVLIGIAEVLKLQELPSIQMSVVSLGTAFSDLSEKHVSALLKLKTNLSKADRKIVKDTLSDTLMEMGGAVTAHQFFSSVQVK
ncbi:hypothetical protein L3Q82_008160 [Scortum barcoo]|uniref:Uncharacterized protein n=1 Tax=Scortum barcoo TaxID=214431 RepID=A0ACB8WHB1_9TELE|nr:hypothetical protein L3Q82_008160 [Scortum barcoo]